MSMVEAFFGNMLSIVYSVDKTSLILESDGFSNLSISGEKSCLLTSGAKCAFYFICFYVFLRFSVESFCRSGDRFLTFPANIQVRKRTEIARVNDPLNISDPEWNAAPAKPHQVHEPAAEAVSDSAEAGASSGGGRQRRRPSQDALVGANAITLFFVTSLTFASKAKLFRCSPVGVGSWGSIHGATRLSITTFNITTPTIMTHLRHSA